MGLLPKREKSSGHSHTRSSCWRDAQAWPLLTWKGPPHAHWPSRGRGEVGWEVEGKGPSAHLKRGMLLVFCVAATSWGFNPGPRREGEEKEEEEAKDVGVGWGNKRHYFDSSSVKGPSPPFTVSQ